MFCQHIFATRTLQTTFTKVFLGFIICFVRHKSVKIFDIYVMWLVFINYKQQIYWIFKFLIGNWKNQLVFITIHVNANVVFPLNLAKYFFSYSKLNSIIIKITSKHFTGLSNSFWMCFYRINMPNMTPWKTFLTSFFSYTLFNSAGNFM